MNRGITLITLFVVLRRSRAKYNEMVASNRWHEGVIVFPDGSVIVRVRSPFRSIDETIEPVYLSRADAVYELSLLTCCRRAKFLRIYFLGADARPQLITLSQSALVDDVVTIAEYINQNKSKNVMTLAPL